MTRAEILTQLQAAKTAHMQWLSRALALIADPTAGQEQVPIAHTDCQLGHWYFGPGQRLAVFASYQAIAAPHERLHRTYAQVFGILAHPQAEPWLTRLLSSSDQRLAKRHQQTDALMQELLGVSRTLLESLVQLEHEVQTKSDAELSAL